MRKIRLLPSSSYQQIIEQTYKLKSNVTMQSAKESIRNTLISLLFFPISVPFVNTSNPKPEAIIGNCYIKMNITSFSLLAPEY